MFLITIIRLAFLAAFFYFLFLILDGNQKVIGFCHDHFGMIVIVLVLAMIFNDLAPKKAS